MGHILEANIDTKVEDLNKRMQQYDEDGTGNIKTMICECKTLFEKMTQVMKASEKKVGKKPYANGLPSSNKLRKAADKMITTRKKLRYERTKHSKDFEQIAIYEAKLQREEIEFKKTQQNATELRDEDLTQLAAKRAEQWNLKASKAIIVIKNAEHAKKTHRKQRNFLKPMSGGIRKIKVPAPISGICPTEKHITDDKVQVDVEKKNKYKLISINCCRLYLQCFFISELMVPHTGIVNKQYLDRSTERTHPQYEIQKCRKPTKLEWSEWRDFIWRNFLIGIYKVHPPLVWEQNTLLTHKDAMSKVEQLTTCNWNDTLANIIQDLPIVWKQILGNITCSNDDGEALAQNIRIGHSIGASNGLLITSNDCEYGGHAYSLNAWDTDDYNITGHAPTPRSTEMTSLTTKLYGLVATTLVLYIICKKHNIQTNTSVLLTVDNEQAVKMGQDWKTPINISETTVHEYDLWRLLWSLKVRQYSNNRN